MASLPGGKVTVYQVTKTHKLIICPVEGQLCKECRVTDLQRWSPLGW